MNPTEQNLENVLRNAPRPVPPGNLEQKLIKDMQQAIVAGTGQRKGWTDDHRGSWFRRWWPALGPAAVSLACAAVLTSQQLEIRSLKQQLQSSMPSVTGSSPASRGNVALTPQPTPAPEQLALNEEIEIQRLRKLTVDLSQEITRLHQMKDENEKLRRQLSAASFANLTQEERDEMQTAKDKAQMINCVNNLKQIGLALRIWALDNSDTYPPNFLVMSNELSTPKILACPSDTAHPAAPDFATFGPANCSYEYFTPAEGENPANEPNRVMVRCPIHGSIGLSDGSVQSEVGKKHPESLIQRNGKLYFQVAPQR